MDFSKIRFDGKHVELEYQESKKEGATADVTTHGENPTPAFKHALQAFTSFVIWVHDWPAEFAERVEIRGVTIKRPDDAERGITVTGLLKCPRARNSTSTFNTPYLSQAPDTYVGDFHGLLPQHVAGFVDELENEAACYLDGERGEQIALDLGQPETPPESAPKKKKKGRDFVPGVGEIVNPEATEPLSDANVRQLLLSVERDVPVDAIAAWTLGERNAAAGWARAVLDWTLGGKRGAAPKEPKCVKRSSTLPLSADEHWDEPAPAIDDVGAEKIRTSARVD